MSSHLDGDLLAGATVRARMAREAARPMREQGVAGIVLSFVDTAGINRIKTVPVERLPAAATRGVGMSPVFDTFLADDSLTTTARFGGPDGDLRLVPDLAALTVLAAQPGWAWAPVNRYTQDGAPYVLCQRRYAAEAASRCQEAGLDVIAAVEIEWAVARGDGAGFEPACRGPAYGMARLVELSDYARDLLVALQREGVEVEQLHPEYSDGQYEVSVGPTDLVTAADRSVLVRQTIRAVSAQHGLQVSFAPSVVNGHVGNGGHIHLSARSGERNIFAGGDRRHGLTAAGEAFAAGILEELPGLCAVGAPTVASYLRLVPSHWAGAFQCWGLETREAALRLVRGLRGDQDRAANIEVKCVDLTANPYLLLGALAGAGLAGVRRQARLPEEVTGDPALLDPAELKARGVQRLPQSLPEAIDALAASATLREVLGDDQLEVVLGVRRAEAERFAGREDDEVVAATRWVY
ncbi:MAG TPA: glutamine synthetase family protein [Segeticoccus sp.]|uniref:glutamine synthetase family protein n=1 Tax=Segeticoccus sp. TaxID=2706531 RepID=UPI002D7E9320|nr:glutamine synthetase family protein [Segeticoccus sp.]HET8602014.1 glutamine synthetase family protein [Segeticoccus sp.]